MSTSLRTKRKDDGVKMSGDPARTKDAAIDWSFTGDASGSTTSAGLRKKRAFHHKLSRLGASGSSRRIGDVKRSKSRKSGGGTAAWDSLNPNFVGVHVAEDAVVVYELITAFDSALSISSGRRPVRTDIDDSEVTLAKEQWDQEMTDLVRGSMRPSNSSVFSADDDDEETEDSSLYSSSADFDPQQLMSKPPEPAPSTPKARRSHPTLGSKWSPSSAKHTPEPPMSPPRQLSASASSFVPITSTPSRRGTATPAPTSPSASATLSRSPSPSFTNFSFPSLNSSYQSLPPALHKDEHGFYSSADVSAHGSSASRRTTPSPTHAHKDAPVPDLGAGPGAGFIPPFLAESARKPSKTRAIVDRLRSGDGRKHPKDPFGADACADAPPASDEDGWITGAGSESKARRTRTLVSALAHSQGRARPEPDALAGQERAQSPAVSASASAADGWVQGPFPHHPAPSVTHSRFSSTSSLGVPPHPPPSVTVPPQFAPSFIPPHPHPHPLPHPQAMMPYPTPPFPAPNAFMQMQHPHPPGPWAGYAGAPAPYAMPPRPPMHTPMHARQWSAVSGGKAAVGRRR